MASISNQASYIEFKIERAADVDIVSSSDEDATTTTTKKTKHRWTCGLRRSTSSSPCRKMELKVSFTIQGVHSFCLQGDPGSGLETHNIRHGPEAQRSVTLQNPGQQNTDTWQHLIASGLSGAVPSQLMEAMAWKLQRDLSALPLPQAPNTSKGGRLLVLHVHVPVKVVTPDGVTAEELLDRVSAPRAERGGEDDCVICLERLDDERGLRKMLVCSHVFHGDCLLRWLLKRASCPVCWSSCLRLFLPRD